jgi:prepilin-type N-terminal cleavage/methylation domain-containing protein
MPTLTSSRRRGYTLVELLIAIMILGIVAAAMTRIMVSQANFTSGQAALRGARSVSRDAYNILMTDLRMVQDSGGLVYAKKDTIKVRIPMAYGLVCATSSAYTTVSLVPGDSALFALGTYGGVAYRDTASGVFNFTPVVAGDVITNEPSPTVCTDSVSGPGIVTQTYKAAGTTITRTGRVVRVKAMPTAPIGSAMFVWQEIMYAFDSSTVYPHRGRGLYRTVTGTGAASTWTRDEIIAPFDSSARFKFYVYNVDTSQKAVPAQISTIRGFDLVLNGLSVRPPSGGNTQKVTKVTTAVFFKTRRDQ